MARIPVLPVGGVRPRAAPGGCHVRSCGEPEPAVASSAPLWIPPGDPPLQIAMVARADGPLLLPGASVCSRLAFSKRSITSRVPKADRVSRRNSSTMQRRSSEQLFGSLMTLGSSRRRRAQWSSA
jgi:hypothetical protein